MDIKGEGWIPVDPAHFKILIPKDLRKNMNLSAFLLCMAAIVAVVSAGGNRSRKSPPDSLFLGRTLGGCSLFGHSCLGGHGKRSSSSSPVTASVESRQQQVGGNMMNWPGEELSPSAAVAELRNSKNRQQILESLVNGLPPRSAEQLIRFLYEDYNEN